MTSFEALVRRQTVDDLAAKHSTHSWNSSLGAQMQTAALVMAMRQLETSS
jgi:hypothetical protein